MSDVTHAAVKEAAGSGRTDDGAATGAAERRPVEVVELVVPGLGPVERQEILRPAGTVPISGDDKAAVYGRPPRAGSATDEPYEMADRQVYDWTRLTIGGASRALWLFLLPFLLVNLVAWTQPRWPAHDDRRRTRLAGGLYEFAARVLALTFTVLAVGTFGQLAMDELVWQCVALHDASGRGPCASGAAAVIADHVPGPPGGLVIAALVPALVAFVLLYLARDCRREYRPVRKTVSRHRADTVREERKACGEECYALELPGFWEYNRRSPGVATQHVWAGLLTTAALLAWPALRADGHGGTLFRVGAGIGSMILLSALVMVVSVPSLHRRRHWPTNYPVRTGVFCALLVVAAGAYCLLPERNWTVRGQLPSVSAQATVLLLCQAGAVLLLLAAALLLPCRAEDEKGAGVRPPHSWTSRRHMALFGLVGPALAVTACFVGWLYTDAAAQWTRSWLAPDGGGLAVPEPVELMGVVLIPVLIAVLVVWALSSVVVRVLSPGDPAHAPDPADSASKDERRHLQELAAARRRHRYLLRRLDWMTAATALLVVVAAIAYYLPLGIRSSQEGTRNFVYDLLGNLSGPLLATLAALMLLAFRALVLRPETRRNAGLAWAFGAFWPRATHPFAPPSWMVRAVPELVWHLRSLLHEPTATGRRVLIRADSMGAVLATAAVWQLTDEERGRVALLTSGCPLATFFQRHYPGFFALGSLHHLAPGGSGAAAGWVNVWRDTDPLGGEVGVKSVDVWWADNSETGPADGERPGQGQPPAVFPPIDGHRNFLTDDRMRALRRSLATRMAGQA